jgi:VPDSG-CTERM motif
MKKCLASALIAFSLVLNVEAQRVPNPDTTTTQRAVSVPDNGSTGVLLGVGLVALAFASRRRLAAR